LRQKLRLIDRDEAGRSARNGRGNSISLGGIMFNSATTVFFVGVDPELSIARRYTRWPIRDWRRRRDFGQQQWYSPGLCCRSYYRLSAIIRNHADGGWPMMIPAKIPPRVALLHFSGREYDVLDPRKEGSRSHPQTRGIGDPEREGEAA
jgi:hypothetical protein